MKLNCQTAAAGVVLLAVLLPGCGSGGSDTSAGNGTAQVLADAIPAISGSCTGGAMSIWVGLDANANGLLDEGEVSYTQLVCPGGGEGWRVDLQAEPGAAGGQRALFSFTGEIRSTSWKLRS